MNIAYEGRKEDNLTICLKKRSKFSYAFPRQMFDLWINLLPVHSIGVWKLVPLSIKELPGNYLLFQVMKLRKNISSPLDMYLLLVDRSSC